ncbi:MAG: branched-chain amino acid ABC transporter substrate-binding protein, partial [Ilumatobacteraceae bacterium]|nr:branched-chain amino acid ABC transporter substrate-binding protein [Ilumatobacteraceae bacterium]
MKKSTVRRVAALAIGLALVASACGSDDASTDTTAAGSDTTAAASTSNGELEGMKGTTPLVALSDDFKTRLKEMDPALDDYSYAAETYDSITVIALAVTQAKSDGIEYAKEINGITRDGEKCTEFKACADLIAAGTDIDYDGVSGPLEFSGNGEPLKASYGVLVFGADNRLADDKTTYIEAAAPADADVPQVDVE